MSDESWRARRPDILGGNADTNREKIIANREAAKQRALAAAEKAKAVDPDPRPFVSVGASEAMRKKQQMALDAWQERQERKQQQARLDEIAESLKRNEAQVLDTNVSYFEAATLEADERYKRSEEAWRAYRLMGDDATPEQKNAALKRVTDIIKEGVDEPN